MKSSMRFRTGITSILPIAFACLLGCAGSGDSDSESDSSNITEQTALPPVSATPLSFDRADALEMAQLSKFVYQHSDCGTTNYKNQQEFEADIERMRAEASAIGYTLEGFSLKADNPSNPFDLGQVFAAIFSNKSQYVLAYRGTVFDSAKNWLADVNFVPTRWVAKGLTHSGFTRTEQALWPFVESFFNDPSHAKKPLWVTGHSLGAAVATLAASHIHKALPAVDIEHIYVFAQPRVGDLTFVNGYVDDGLDSKFIKFAGYNDAVSVLPLAGMGFFDSRRIAYLAEDHKLYHVDTAYELRKGIQFDAVIIRKLVQGFNKLGLGSAGELESLNKVVNELLNSGGKALSASGQAVLQNFIDNQFPYLLASHDIKSYISALQTYEP
jgi:hypothetical protein